MFTQARSLQNQQLWLRASSWGQNSAGITSKPDAVSRERRHETPCNGAALRNPGPHIWKNAQPLLMLPLLPLLLLLLLLLLLPPPPLVPPPLPKSTIPAKDASASSCHAAAPKRRRACATD